jgi:hypothetical protein
MKTLYTNKGQEILVDEKYYDLLSKYTWNINSRGYVTTTKYIMSRKQSRETGLKRGVDIIIHRLIYQLEYGVSLKSSQHIDHINRKPFDNRVENLRLSPLGTSINQINVSLRADNTTGYKGVIFREKTGKYEAKISYKGKRIWLGAYVDINDAAKAYNKKALELFGDACYLNKIKL